MSDTLEKLEFKMIEIWKPTGKIRKGLFPIYFLLQSSHQCNKVLTLLGYMDSKYAL